MKKYNAVEKELIKSYGLNGLEPVKSLDWYKPIYRKLMTDLFNTIKLYDIRYCGWSKKIFYRELAEEIVSMMEYGNKKDIIKILKQNNDKKTMSTLG